MPLARWMRSRSGRSLRSRKAISTIMANLTMLIIVVFLSSLLFVWAVSSFGAYQGGAGYWFSSKSLANQERLSIDDTFFTGASHNTVLVYVRNVGQIPFTVASVYVNSTLYQITPQTINVTQVVTLGGPGGFQLSGQTWTHGNLQSITVATTRGTVVTTTWVS